MIPRIAVALGGIQTSTFQEALRDEQTNVLRTQDFYAIRNGPAHGIIEKNDGRAPRAIGGESHG